MNCIQYIGSQFAKPEGFTGRIATYLMNGMNRKQYHFIRGCIKPRDSNATVLDIGFGNGYLLRRLAKDNCGVFYGVDISKDMVQRAQRENRALTKQGRAFFELGNILALPYGDNTFQYCYTVNTVYFWGDALQGFREAYRVLKPGGIFANAFYTKEFLDTMRYTQYQFQKYTPHALMGLAKQAGFSDLQLIEIRKGISYGLRLTK